jgi:hypothetical protein
MGSYASSYNEGKGMGIAFAETGVIVPWKLLGASVPLRFEFENAH